MHILNADGHKWLLHDGLAQELYPKHVERTCEDQRREMGCKLSPTRSKLADRLITMTRIAWFALFLLGLLVATFLSAQNVVATDRLFRGASSHTTENTIIVTTVGDSIKDNDGLCSLREAIISANSNPNELMIAGECWHGREGQSDVIVLENGTSYSLLLDGSDEDGALTGDLDILDNNAALDLIIRTEDPDGDPATIDASTLTMRDRVLHVIAANVKVENVIVAGGESSSAGGGIRIDTENAALTLLGATVGWNKSTDVEIGGGGIAHLSAGVLTIDNSLIGSNQVTGNGNGGGILTTAEGAVEIRNGSRIMSNLVDMGCGAGIYLMDGGMLSIGNSQLISNVSNGHGGAICNLEGAVSLTETELQHNSASGYGGGIYTKDGTFNIVASQLEDNRARLGGALYAMTDEIVIDQSAMVSNSASNEGGSIYSENSSLSLSASTFEDNSSGSGGAVTVKSGPLIATDSAFIQNSATFGGGLYIRNGNATLENLLVESNQTSGRGGGIFLLQSSAELTDSTFRENQTIGGFGGGAIRVDQESDLHVRRTEFLRNDVFDGGGGAVSIAPEGSATVEESYFFLNYASTGGAVHNNGRLTVMDSTFENNHARFGHQLGGAIYMEGVVLVRNSTFHRNEAKFGGALFVEQAASTQRVWNSTLGNNEASQNGGAIYVKNGGSLQVNHSTIAFNTAAQEGAGLYVADDGILLVQDSIVSTNPAAGGNGDCAHHATGILQANGVNLDGDGTCPNFSMPNQNPQLGALSDNGGKTVTYLPGAASPALNAASTEGCAVVGHLDQRGYSRGETCDLGAVDRDGVLQVEPTTTPTHVPTATPSATPAVTAMPTPSMTPTPTPTPTEEVIIDPTTGKAFLPLIQKQ